MRNLRLPGARSAAANLVAFQLCWIMSVMGAAAGWPWLGPLAIAVWLYCHLSFVADAPKRELPLYVFAALAGWAADSALVTMGWLSFPAPAQLGGPSTLWMAGLWAGFAATVPHSLRWLHRRHCRRLPSH